MQETKYFYDGIPLGEYCKIHDINVNTIRTRIWKKKQAEKYKHLSDADIIDMVIKAYGTNVVYTYKKMSLRQYCQKNKLNYHTILSRIKRLKENPTIKKMILK